MDNYKWMNASIKKQIKSSQRKGKTLRLVDILDEMNLKEDTTNKMVIKKLEKLARVIFEVDKYSDDVQFVSNIMEDLIQLPHKRITKIEIEKCNELWKQYQL